MLPNRHRAKREQSVLDPSSVAVSCDVSNAALQTGQVRYSNAWSLTAQTAHTACGHRYGTDLQCGSWVLKHT